ncbi:MAG: DUF3422 domain-containing protein [Asticcacaulis sp.]
MTQTNDHPQRRRLSDLMHARALPIFKAPVVVRSWLYLVADEDRGRELQWIDSLDGDHGDERWTLHNIGASGGMIWERHGEFSTWLRYAALDGRPRDLGFCRLKTADFPWLTGAPGSLFRSVEIVVRPLMPKPAQFDGEMDLTSAVCCDVFDGKARIWSDFRMHEGGAGRIYVQDRGLQNDELARLLQILIEIGHYRKLALLGFPPARDLMPWLKAAEARLAALTNDMASQAASQEVLLERLMGLAAEIESRVNEGRFRQGATEAYYRLTVDRLLSLRESRVAGFSTMQEFIERRLQPAMRTCEAVSRRLDDLSARVGRMSDLLRARISISLEMQNQDLLRSMNLRARLQIKLQGLVEGLSVFGVSYYIFSLVKYLLDAMLPAALAHGLYAPVIAIILLTAWLFIRSRKKAIGGEV